MVVTKRYYYPANQARWASKNKEAIAARMAEYRQRPEVLERKKAWRQSPRGKIARARLEHNRRAGTRGTWSLDDWDALVAKFEGLCAYCMGSDQITVDHVVPVSKNGPNTIDNLLPACGPCNSSKGNKPLTEWLRGGGRYRSS